MAADVGLTESAALGEAIFDGAPTIDGLEVLRRVRAAPELGKTVCIALSANAMAEDIVRARAAGFADYWTKPIAFGPFLAQLDALIDALNDTGYALTLGIHSRIDATVDRIVSRTRAGNVYVNRNIVGAVVGVQPFGGEGKSGQGNPHPVSPWGWNTKGKKTRRNKRTASMIIRRRN